MTLLDIKNYTTGKLGITDAAALAQADLFTKARWRMIWNDVNWRQARYQQTLSIAAGTQDVTLDPLFEFVTAARWADTYELMATDDISALASNPGGYDTAGPVLAFVPLGKDSNGNAQIRLLHKADQTKNLFVIGKRKCVELVNPTDTPLIPGADQVLCELVMGDLYEWLRQLTKAAQFFQKGAILLEKMKEIEMAQTAEVRRIIPTEQILDDEPNNNWLR